jgi:hypothetical protein
METGIGHPQLDHLVHSYHYDVQLINDRGFLNNEDIGSCLPDGLHMVLQCGALLN